MIKDSSVAVFIDVENIHYSTLNNYSETPDWSWVIAACKHYGRIASIQAFGDWIEFSKEVPEIQKNGIQPIFVPLSQGGKSSLDCYLTVSAMKLFFQNNTIDTFILASGDRDYIPLIAELKALGKKVVILAVPDTLSHDLTMMVDAVISYQPRSKHSDETQKQSNEQVQAYVLETLREMEKHAVNDRWVNLASIGLALKKKDGSFCHTHYGYTKLAEMLDDMPSVELKYDNFEKTIAVARTRQGQIEAAPQGEVFYGSIINIKEGFGFIKPDLGGENIFFHFSKLKNIRFEELRIGDAVSYTTYNTDKGLNAEEIEWLGDVGEV